MKFKCLLSILVGILFSYSKNFAQNSESLSYPSNSSLKSNQPRKNYVALDHTSILKDLSEQDKWILAHPFDSVNIDKDYEKYHNGSYCKSRVIYPNKAKYQGIEGTVKLRVLIDKEGFTRKIIVVSSDSDLLIESAVEAVETSHFIPARIRDEKIYCWLSVPIVYRLR
jgi:TonB family protein